MADRFEDLDAWKGARERANLIYKFGRKSGFPKDYGFNDFNGFNGFNEQSVLTERKR